MKSPGLREFLLTLLTAAGIGVLAYVLTLPFPLSEEARGGIGGGIGALLGLRVVRWLTRPE